jgi:hypothetical protein
MRWGLIPGHNLATPFTVARPLEINTIIRTVVHKMSDLGKMLTTIRMEVV